MYNILTTIAVSRLFTRFLTSTTFLLLPDCTWSLHHSNLTLTVHLFKHRHIHTITIFQSPTETSSPTPFYHQNVWRSPAVERDGGNSSTHHRENFSLIVAQIDPYQSTRHASFWESIRWYCVLHLSKHDRQTSERVSGDICVLHHSKLDRQTSREYLVILCSTPLLHDSPDFERVFWWYCVLHHFYSIRQTSREYS